MSYRTRKAALNAGDSEYNDEIARKEKKLLLKEKELKKKEKELQKRLKVFKKRGNRRARADLTAAAKLRDARKKLLLVLDSKHKKCNEHTCKGSKQKRLLVANQYQDKKKKKPSQGTCLRFLQKSFSTSCIRLGAKNNLLKSLFDPNRYQCGWTSSRFPCIFDYQPRKDYIRDITHKEGMWNSAAGDCYLESLRSRPKVWINHRWPQFYPHYLNTKKQWKNVGYTMLFLASFLFWVPVLICLELCKCFFCTCCCDC